MDGARAESFPDEGGFSAVRAKRSTNISHILIIVLPSCAEHSPMFFFHQSVGNGVSRVLCKRGQRGNVCEALLNPNSGQREKAGRRWNAGSRQVVQLQIQVPGPVVICANFWSGRRLWARRSRNEQRARGGMDWMDHGTLPSSLLTEMPFGVVHRLGMHLQNRRCSPPRRRLRARGSPGFLPAPYNLVLACARPQHEAVVPSVLGTHTRHSMWYPLVPNAIVQLGPHSSRVVHD